MGRSSYPPGSLFRFCSLVLGGWGQRPREFRSWPVSICNDRSLSFHAAAVQRCARSAFALRLPLLTTLSTRRLLSARKKACGRWMIHSSLMSRRAILLSAARLMPRTVVASRRRVAFSRSRGPESTRRTIVLSVLSVISKERNRSLRFEEPNEPSTHGAAERSFASDAAGSI